MTLLQRRNSLGRRICGLTSAGNRFCPPDKAEAFLDVKVRRELTKRQLKLIPLVALPIKYRKGCQQSVQGSIYTVARSKLESSHGNKA